MTLDMVLRPIDPNTVAGAMALDLLDNPPQMIECRYRLPPWGSIPRDYVDRMMAQFLVDFAEREGRIIVTEHSTRTFTSGYGDVVTRWALTVPRAAAPPYPEGPQTWQVLDVGRALP